MTKKWRTADGISGRHHNNTFLFFPLHFRRLVSFFFWSQSAPRPTFLYTIFYSFFYAFDLYYDTQVYAEANGCCLCGGRSINQQQDEKKKKEIFIFHFLSYSEKCPSRTRDFDDGQRNIRLAIILVLFVSRPVCVFKLCNDPVDLSLFILLLSFFSCYSSLFIWNFLFLVVSQPHGINNNSVAISKKCQIVSLTFDFGLHFFINYYDHFRTF